MNLQRFYVAICLVLLSTSLLAAIPANCDSLQQAKGYPEYYCDCKYDYSNFVLPFDTVVSYESIWLKGWVSDLYDGLSAYLHSDCDLNFEVYASCTAKEPRYQAIFTQNEASAIDGEAIKRKLEENQVGSLDVAFYICISPIGGEGGRLIMRKESDGMPSTCEDPLYMLPGMSLYSTQANDVYVVDPTELNELTDIILQWEPDEVASCQLKVTSGSCDGPIIAQANLESYDAYVLSAASIREALEKNDNLYLHFSHAANKAGMVRCLAPIYEENYIDTLLCQGMGLAVHDTLLTEPTVYTIDTIYDYSNVYLINLYNLEFYEPDLQYDTLGLYESQLPYLYRGQFAVTDFVDYDITIHTPGACDEKYALHVYHKIDTILTVRDTTLCYGATFEHNGRIYQYDVSFGSSSWKNADTLLIDSLNVYFATTPEIIYDTLQIAKGGSIRKYSTTFRDFGDYEVNYTDPNTMCEQIIYVHVKEKINVTLLDSVVATLCQGLEYEYYGTIYTTSVSFRDTFWMNSNTCEVTPVMITFIEPEGQPDTLFLKSTDLPYTYRNQHTISEYGDYDLTIHLDGECDERYLLHVAHDIDTLTQSIDTTLCQGKVYLYDEVEYTSSTAFVDSTWLNADTYSITSVTVTFLSPEAVSDTLSLKSTDLPYTYRNQHTISEYGDYDLTIHLDGECDERYLLHVAHDIDTLIQSIDTTLCQGKVYLYDEVEYTSSTAFVDSTWLNADTYSITSVTVTFLSPEAVSDTLSLKSTDLPYTYRNQHTISEYGDYDLTIHVDGECDERYLLHVAHDIDTLTQSIDTTLCQGKVYLYNEVEYTSSTAFVDSTWLNADTYSITSVTVTFLSPEAVSDTLSLKSTDLPYTYRNQHTISEYGDYDLTIHVDGECDERYLLHVAHDIDTLTQSIDTTLCQGKVYLYDEVEYTSSTAFVDSTWLNADTYSITSVTVTFLSPEAVSDTLSLKSTDLPYTYRNQHTISEYGDYDLTIHLDGECDERYLLHVAHDIDTLLQSIDTTLCQGKVYLYNEVEYTSSTTFVDSTWLNADTYSITSVTVTFLSPEAVSDTLSLKSTDLPYTYRNQHTISEYGDYDLTIHVDGECDERYLLHVAHDVDTVISVVDTLLCYGATFELAGEEFVHDTILVQTEWSGADSLLIDTIRVAFALVPDQVYDTLAITPADLPYNYYEQLIPDFGDYEFMLYNAYGCLEQVLLHVCRTTTTDLPEQPVIDRPRLLMRNGIVYILRGSEVFTLLGEKVE